MLLHDLPLLQRQVAALLQNRIWYGDLAQIVQIPPAPQRHKRIFIQPQMPPQIRSAYGQPLAMPLGIRIAAFHTQPKRAQN